MTTDLLRHTAALMRERANDVWDYHKSPWHTTPGPAGWAVVRSIGVIDDTFNGESGVQHDTYVFQMDTPGTAEHIASWHPAVALAVADWLDHEADRHARGLHGIEAAEAAGASERTLASLRVAAERAVAPALAVARAYLGDGAA